MNAKVLIAAAVSGFVLFAVLLGISPAKAADPATPIVPPPL